MKRKKYKALTSLMFMICILLFLGERECVKDTNNNIKKFDLLLLSPSIFKSPSKIPEEIKKLKERCGLKVDLKYLEADVYAGETNIDKAAKIKKFIYNHAMKFETKFVLLIGDSDCFPVRYVPFPTNMKKQRILNNIYARVSYLSEPLTDCGSHLNWANFKSNTSVLTELKVRINDVYGKLSGDVRSNIYADIAVFLNSFGIDFGSESRNSLDKKSHINWANSATTPDLIKETEIRFNIIFDTIEKSSVNPAVWMFTSDSIFLTTFGISFPNDARNSKEPSVHFNWAKNVPVQKIADDFVDKCAFLIDKSNNFRSVFAEISLHQRLYGLWLGHNTPNDNDINGHNSWAAQKKAKELIDEIRKRTIRSYIYLLNDYYWIASDLYYSTIIRDGVFDDWDTNGNGIYGEIEIKENQFIKYLDEFDLTPDIMVGRIPASNPLELAFYLNKMKYSKDSPNKAKNFSRIDVFDKPDPFISSDDYKIVIDPGIFRINRKDPANGDVNQDVQFLYHQLNKQDCGLAVVSMHGTPSTMAGILDVDPATLISQKLKNKENLPILWSASCLNGRFTPIPHDNSAPTDYETEYKTKDGTYKCDDRNKVDFNIPQPDVLQEGFDVNCVAEHLTIKGNSGVIAFIGSHLLTNLSSMIEYTKEFLTHYNDLDGNTIPSNITLGDLFLKTQQDFIKNKINGKVDNKLKTLFMMNLFGDPSLKLKEN